MYDSITIYGTKPSGATIFACADLDYYDRFSKRLAESAIANINNTTKLHFHIIIPSDKAIDAIKIFVSNRITYSWEFINNSQPFEQYKNVNLIVATPQVKHMLAVEYQKNIISKKIVVAAQEIDPPTSDDIVKFVNENLIRTYYSIRRFLLPQAYFSEITGLLIVDIDSYFNNDIQIEALSHSGFSRAIHRKNSWSKYLAGVVYAHFEEQGKSQFLNILKTELVNIIRTNGLHWGVDQLALDSCAKYDLIRPLTEFTHSFKKTNDISIAFVSIKGIDKWKS